MIFSWEFSKLLESIIFRNIFICVEKLNYIKNYMKTRRDTRREGQPIMLNVEGALKHF